MDMYEILVPTVRNSGKPFRTRHHKNWDKKVLRITGGLTVLKPVKGYWVNSCISYDERMIPVRIACSRKQINRIIDITLKHYDQLAVMAYKVSDDVIIKYKQQEVSK